MTLKSIGWVSNPRCLRYLWSGAEYGLIHNIVRRCELFLVFTCGELRERYRIKVCVFVLLFTLRLHIGDKNEFVSKIQARNKAHSLQNQRGQFLGPIVLFRDNNK